MNKPKYTAPCNHCGECCKAITCQAAETLGHGEQGPCPLLRETEKGFFCGLVLDTGSDSIIARVLGIGMGCSMVDDDTTEEEMQRFHVASLIKTYGSEWGILNDQSNG